MKYDWKFKYQCILDYKEGKEVPEEYFPNKMKRTDYIDTWIRLFNIYGIEGLKHKTFNKVWTKEQRYELVAKVLAGRSNKSVAIEAGISDGQLCQWVKRYIEYGYDGLELRKRGRPPKEGITMTGKKKEKPSKLSQSEREELILLRRKLQYAEAENAYLKKLAALTAKKKMESSAKAKKQ